MPKHVAQPPLATYRHDVYSQHGEDGIIGEILSRIGGSFALDGWCVEFGAWDGIHLSNTYNLIENRGYRAVLIEGDRRKYRELCANIPSADVIKIRQLVELDGEASLDSLLQGTPIPDDFDFLSIDIDGCDYFILQSLTGYRPKIICIEYNPTIPNDVAFIQQKSFSIKHGSSARAIIELASAKGYSLAAVTTTNLILVDTLYRDAVIGAEEVHLDRLRDDAHCKQYVFCGYDGTILSDKPHIRLLWHGVSVDLGSIQPLPRYLRRFSSDYTVPQKMAFGLFLLICFPKVLYRRLVGLIS